MITTAGKTAFGQLVTGVSTSPFLYLAYGSGTTAESSSQTALVTETGRSRAYVQYSSTLSPHDTISFAAIGYPTAAGTVNEVGLFDASTSGTMFLRKKLTTGTTYTAYQMVFIYVTVQVTDGGFGAS